MATQARSQAKTCQAAGADRPEREPSRPWPVYLVAGLLVGIAGLVVWSPFRQDQPAGPLVVCVAAFFLAVAVALLAWRRVGWWTAVVVLALLVLVQVATTVGKPSGGNLVGCGYELTALGLLMLPSVRRHRSLAAAATVSAATGAPASPGLSRPSGWTREWLGGWFKCLGIGLFGVLSLLVGLGMLGASTTTSDGPGLPGSLVVALFGLTLLAAVPMFWPMRRSRPTVERVTVEDRSLRGLVFPYSRLRTSAGLAACVGFVVAGVVLAVAPDPSGTRWSAAALRVVGVLCALVFGAFTALYSRRRNRCWVLVATPDVVGTVGAPVGGLVPWSAITGIEAAETTTTVRGGRVHEPHIAVMVTGDEHINQDSVDAALTSLGRRFRQFRPSWAASAARLRTANRFRCGVACRAGAQ